MSNNLKENYIDLLKKYEDICKFSTKIYKKYSKLRKILKIQTKQNKIIFKNKVFKTKIYS